MLNPELKKDLDIEIEKSEPLTKEFLTSDYFRETMDLVFKVNRLNDEQKESVELETILYILGLSNYENITDAIKDECGLETPATIRQLTDDLDKYILEKIKSKTLEISIEKNDSTETSNILSVLPMSSELPENTSNIFEGVGDIKVKNLLDKNFDVEINEPRDLVKNIITPETKKQAENITNKIEEGEISQPVEEKKLGDVYRERLDEMDTIIKKEI
jgi:hypothetical protein